MEGIQPRPGDGLNWWFAAQDYISQFEGQHSAVQGEPFHILDDSDNEWWYAISARTEQSGYIPALLMESPNHQSARSNAELNRKIEVSTEDAAAAKRPRNEVSVVFARKVDSSDGKRKSLARPGKIKRGTIKLPPGGDPEKDEEPGATTHVDQLKNFGLIRVHAGIWNLGVSYKAVKVTMDSTTSEVIATALQKFTENNTIKLAGDEVFNLFLASGANGNDERCLSKDMRPLEELSALPDSQRSAAKFILKKVSIQTGGTPTRIYSDESSFKTIIVDGETTVQECVVLGIAKFKASTDGCDYALRFVSGGEERILEEDERIQDILQDTPNYKLYIKRRVTEKTDSGSKRLLRIFGGALDMDVAYKTIVVSEQQETLAVITMALDRYNSMLDPGEFQLIQVVHGKDVKVLEASDCPLVIQKGYEEENPNHIDSVKMVLRRENVDGSTKVFEKRLSMGNIMKIPLRVYCSEVLDKQGQPSFKALLVNADTHAGTLLKQAIDSFKIPEEPKLYPVTSF